MAVNQQMARNIFLFLRPATIDASLWSVWEVLPKIHTISQLEPKWRQLRLKFQRILSRTRRYFTPPVGTAVRQSRNGSYYRDQKKNLRSSAESSSGPLLQQESPPVREAGVASRNTILFGGRDRSPQDSSFFSTRVAPRKKECFFSTRVAPRKKEGC